MESRERSNVKNVNKTNKTYRLICRTSVNIYCCVCIDLDLDLVPPVPDGTLGDEISPPVSIVGSSPCTTPS